jgi:hypothetical protein
MPGMAGNLDAPEVWLLLSLGPIAIFGSIYSGEGKRIRVALASVGAIATTLGLFILFGGIDFLYDL